MVTKTVKTLKSDKGVRVDKYLSDTLSLSRSFVQELITTGLITLEGKSITKNHILKGEETLQVTIPEPKGPDLTAKDLPLDIVFEDDHLLVINKPQGMVVHPAPGNYEDTLVNALMHHCEGSLSTVNDETRPGIVHRLDKDTSGLMVVAKTDQAHHSLAAQIVDRSFVREYQALVLGNIKEDQGEIDKPLGRHPVNRKKISTSTRRARKAKTLFWVIERFGEYTHLRLRLVTGRTHQIRVHLSSEGHPIVGDITYGDRKNMFSLSGQSLFAAHIEFIHPVTGERMEFSIKPPESFSQVLEKLRG